MMGAQIKSASSTRIDRPQRSQPIDL